MNCCKSALAQLRHPHKCLSCGNTPYNELSSIASTIEAITSVWFTRQKWVRIRLILMLYVSLVFCWTLFDAVFSDRTQYYFKYATHWLLLLTSMCYFVCNFILTISIYQHITLIASDDMSLQEQLDNVPSVHELGLERYNNLIEILLNCSLSPNIIFAFIYWIIIFPTHSASLLRSSPSSRSSAIYHLVLEINIHGLIPLSMLFEALSSSRGLRYRSLWQPLLVGLVYCLWTLLIRDDFDEDMSVNDNNYHYYNSYYYYEINDYSLWLVTNLLGVVLIHLCMVWLKQRILNKFLIKIKINDDAMLYDAQESVQDAAATGPGSNANHSVAGGTGHKSGKSGKHGKHHKKQRRRSRSNRSSRSGKGGELTLERIQTFFMTSLGHNGSRSHHSYEMTSESSPIKDSASESEEMDQKDQKHASSRRDDSPSLGLSSIKIDTKRRDSRRNSRRSSRHGSRRNSRSSSTLSPGGRSRGRSGATSLLMQTSASTEESRNSRHSRNSRNSTITPQLAATSRVYYDRSDAEDTELDPYASESDTELKLGPLGPQELDPLAGGKLLIHEDTQLFDSSPREEMKLGIMDDLQSEGKEISDPRNPRMSSDATAVNRFILSLHRQSERFKIKNIKFGGITNILRNQASTSLHNNDTDTRNEDKTHLKDSNNSSNNNININNNDSQHQRNGSNPTAAGGFAILSNFTQNVSKTMRNIFNAPKVSRGRNSSSGVRASGNEYNLCETQDLTRENSEMTHLDAHHYHTRMQSTDARELMLSVADEHVDSSRSSRGTPGSRAESESDRRHGMGMGMGPFTPLAPMDAGDESDSKTRDDAEEMGMIGNAKNAGLERMGSQQQQQQQQRVGKRVKDADTFEIGDYSDNELYSESEGTGSERNDSDEENRRNGFAGVGMSNMYQVTDIDDIDDGRDVAL